MLETLMFKQGKKSLGLDAIAFKTSSAGATTITTSQLGEGFTTEYSIDGGLFVQADASFSVPAGEHEVILKLNVTTDTSLILQPFKDIITEVTDWESSQLSNIRFTNCAKLTNVPAYLPAAITDLSYMFYDCSVFNQYIGNWDTSNVTNMNAMFDSCIAFNQDIGGWDTSNVTSMYFMFNACANFNQDIGGWDTGKVTNMNAMFNNCKVFNQYVGDWNTSNVTSMYFTFNGCSAFNQDIGNWDVGKVTNMSAMLQSCSSFNQNISNWNVSRVTDMSYMLQNCKAFNQDLSSMVFKSSVTRTSYDVGTTAWLSAYRPKFTG